MGILRTFECAAHGGFESWDEEPRCPKGCNTVQRVFVQAPGMIGQRTRNKDLMQRDIASSFGLTDMSNKDGTSVASNIKKQSKSFALPSTSFEKNPDGSIRKKQLDIGSVIAGSGAFEHSAPQSIQQSDVSAREAISAVAGTRVRNTKIAGACDRDGRLVNPSSVSVAR